MCNCHRELIKHKQYNLKLLNRIQEYKEIIKELKACLYVDTDSDSNNDADSDNEYDADSPD